VRGLAALAAGLVLVLDPAVAPAAAAPAACAGGETLRPLLAAWAQAAQARDPTVRVTVDPGAALSAEGMGQLLDGHAACVTMVREPFPSELAAFRARFGHEPLLIPVARGSFATRGGTHAIAIYVNAANPVAGLTLAQLAAAFGGAHPAATWGGLGATGAWADRPLHAYGMTPRRASGDPPGVVNFLQQRMLGGGAFRDDLAVQVDRPGEQALAAIVRKVAEDPDGIGYSGFGYAQPGARTVPLAAHDGGTFVAGSAASVADGRYPLARHVYLLADRPLAPALRGLLAFVLSPAGQAMIARDAEGFLPLTPAERASAKGLVR
jgi:phosphate transport system substrate-binding protein